MLSGKVVDKTFNAGVKVETANVDKREMQYLYADGDDFVFMDTGTYDQIHVPAATVGDARNFMLESQTAVGRHQRRQSAVRRTARCRRVDHHLHRTRSARGPVDRRDQARHVETGYEIAVPLFIWSGEKVKVDTRDGSYLGRAN